MLDTTSEKLSTYKVGLCLNCDKSEARNGNRTENEEPSAKIIYWFEKEFHTTNHIFVIIEQEGQGEFSSSIN